MKKQKEEMQVNVAGLRRNIKNLAHNYSDAQVKVREVTSNDPWGPSPAIMAEIADLTYNVVAFSEIMQMIWKRLNDHGKNWRHVYKALILLDYLIKMGIEKVAQQCKENIFAIQTLKEFIYFEEGKDQGTHVREKAKQLVDLLKDDERLKNERIKALQAKERFAQHPSGFGSDGYIDGPLHRDMPPGWQEEPKPLSELEAVRPQTAGEEELQLQLAMAMSREEAEQEEAKRRSDDVRLQLALSQSEQDFKEQVVKPTSKREEPQSHLLDLLDISLGATSISSPPLGATGGHNGDPWGTSGRAASQLSDPWSGTSSPQIDPWQPAASMRAATASAPLGAIGGGIGSNGADSWGGLAARTQSPSVASGSSTEGWLHSNGAVGNATLLNGNSIGAGAIGRVDPWLAKSGSLGGIGGAATVEKVEPVDPWLAENIKPVNIAPLASASTTAGAPPSTVDPWAPKAGATLNDDPWKGNGMSLVKPSPDLDEFDIITNRNKTEDLLNSSATNASNNNNASLLDEMDPLSATNSTLNTLSTNTKKQLKTPQSFLGENSSLVNLDNLIKPVQIQSETGNTVYNPFSDTVLPPKTNLFQQQQPAVPSINQLKQQQPFAMTINQDPWAPVNNTTNASQPSRNFFTDYEASVNVNNNNNNNTNDNKSKNNGTLQYSKSDYDVFNTSFGATNDFFNYNHNNICNNNNKNINSNNNRLDGPYQFQTQVQVHSQSVDNIRNMQIINDIGTDIIYEKSSLQPQMSLSTSSNNFKNTNNTNSQTLSTNQYQFSTTDFNNRYKQDFTASSLTSNNINQNNNKNNNNTLSNNSSYSFNHDQSLINSDILYQPRIPSTINYSNALTAALADTPGIKIASKPIMPFSASTSSFFAAASSMPFDYGDAPPSGGDSFGSVDNGGVGLSSLSGGSLFNYGFYDGNNLPNGIHNDNNNTNLKTNNNAIFSKSTSSLANCKLENNNNMPWMNTEATSSSNPFLS